MYMYMYMYYIIMCSYYPQDSAVDANQALFQPFPSEIIFQQYEKKKAYEFPLSLRNLDKVLHVHVYMYIHV